MKEYTPIIKQYLNIKSQHLDKIVLFRVGDFYELFFEDAIEVSRLLFLNLTSKGKYKGEKIPMAGFPARSANSYITKLMRLNKKVVICEQINESKKNGLIERKVVKILTPGTFFNDNYLSEDKNNYIICISYIDNFYGISMLDVSTGYFAIMRIENKFDLYNEVDKINPSEILISDKFNNLKFLSKNFFINKIPGSKFNYDFSYNVLVKFFGKDKISHIDFNYFKSSIISAGCLLDFVLFTQNNKLENVVFLNINDINSFLYLDSNTRRNLELFKNISGENKNTLFSTIDKTSTSMGKRLLRRWLAYPVLSQSIIMDRLKGVSILKNNQNFFKIKSSLSSIFDLERILSKIIFSICKPQDLKQLQESLKVLPFLKIELSKLKLDGILETIYHNMYTFESLVKLIEKAINDNPPATFKDGNFIKNGFDKKLDSYRNIYNNVNNFLLAYQESERLKLNSKTLNINFLPKFGYFIEIFKIDKVIIPDSYKKISNTSKSIRYTTDELIDIEKKVFEAKIESLNREKKIYKIILYLIKKSVFNIQITSKYIAILDVINSFAYQSSFYDWCEPILCDFSILDIKSGRHPVIEIKNNNMFISNDIFLNEKNNALIITGPNMGGKSTYMRQNAIMIILCYIGCHVPAKSAKIGFFDKIFTRIGASDDLTNSCSTFMVEMKEVADILNKATSNSFILIDEIGRGTSYFEGKALAFAILKELLENNKSYFLFSTHFHDLHLICDDYPNINKICFLAYYSNNVLKFFYKFEYGVCENSFGIEVANIAGLPKNVIFFANKKFNEFKYECSFNNSRLFCNKCNKCEKIKYIFYNLKKESLSNSEISKMLNELKILLCLN